MITKEKKQLQLGMNPSTAQHALKKQLMFYLAQQCGMDDCFQCGGKIENKEDLSVEHKIPWLDSEDPKALFFDLDNVAFSHLTCNVKARRVTNRTTPEDKKLKRRINHAVWYTPEKRRERRERYERTGN